MASRQILNVNILGKNVVVRMQPANYYAMISDLFPHLMKVLLSSGDVWR
jgi:hypothetical protein